MYDDHIVKQIKKQVRGFEEKSRGKIIDAQVISVCKLDELTLKKIEEFLKKDIKSKK